MRNCTSPYDHTSNPVFLVTNVILLPVIIGIGLIGNLLTIIIFNRSQLRTTNAIYVYLTGLATCDLLMLLLVIPKGLRDMGALDLEVGFCKQMAQFITFQYGLSNIFKHSASWIIVWVIGVRLVAIGNPFKRYWVISISSSRIIVFLIVIFCVIIDFPRFFELRVVELRGHCLERMTLWTWGYTQLANDPLFLTVYPWLVVIVSFGLPFLLILLLVIILMVRIKIWRVIRDYMTVRNAAGGNDTQINILLIVITGTFFILELPDAVAHAFLAIDPSHKSRYTLEYNNFTLISNCMSLIHSSINFILYTLVSSEFRKTFRRTFCCTCLTGDEYYEPVKCVDILMCRCNKQTPRDHLVTGSSTTSSTKRSTGEPAQIRRAPPRVPPPYHGPNVARGGWI